MINDRLDRLDRLDRAYFDIKIISLVYSDLVLKKLYFLRAINSISISLADVSKKMVDFTF